MITLAEHAGTNRNVPIRPDRVALGLMVDFGTHVAAVWEDRAPLGVLDGSDLLAHHLGGRPEISTLSALAETRPKFAVRMWPESQKLQLAIAGDVVLAGEPAGVEEFVRAMAGADLALANLEGVCSGQPASANQTDDFRFPRERLEILKRAGVTAVGMANNHALCSKTMLKSLSLEVK